MPTNTYVALDKVTVGTATASITFTSINQTYTDLVIVCNGTASADTGLYAQFNGDTTNNYSMTVVGGSGTAASSERQTSVGYARFVWNSYWNTSTPGTAIVNIQNYSNATTQKVMLWRSSTSSKAVEAGANLWRATPAAITSIVITAPTGNIAVGSTFSLYGIRSQATPGTAKATGGTITYDKSGNVIHTFTAGGTFTPSANLTNVDYLVIAGGGGGGFRQGGGGGAGGYRSSLTPSGANSGGEGPTTCSSGVPITITVGNGGAGATGEAFGSNGQNSSFGSIVAVGGGGGGSYNANTGASGGSGGGAGYGTIQGGGAGTASQGNKGGAGVVDGGSGGGGAGAIGAGGFYLAGGSTGGSGLFSSISGTYTAYAGGGGGGGPGGTTIATGGLGGGASGGMGTNNGSSAANNTGSGGGGGGQGGGPTYQGYNGGAGGSGIVIIRYSGI